MDLDLAGRYALICGSTQGIGLACATEIALLGANVILFARNEKMLKRCVEGLPQSNNQKHHYLAADFQSPKRVKSAVEAWISKGNSADILVNNTGGPPAGPIETASSEDFRSAFNSHLICNQILAQAVLPGMKANGFGRIINIISIGAKIPLEGLGVSNTIRGAVANWAKTLAGEVAPFGITVNNMLPGLCWTARLESLLQSQAEQQAKSMEAISDTIKATIPARRFGRPEELAAVVAFLASPAAAYLNGTNIPVDGGRTPCL